MRITREEAIRRLARYDTEYYTPQTREAHLMAIDALKEQETHRWISVTERLPQNFVSVLGYMTDAGEFPPVRECYTVGNAFFFPALGDVHPVSHWKPMPEPPKEDAKCC